MSNDDDRDDDDRVSSEGSEPSAPENAPPIIENGLGVPRVKRPRGRPPGGGLPRGRSSSKFGNRNASSHGVNTFLRNGVLPKGNGNLARDQYALRRRLAEDVSKKHGDLTLVWIEKIDRVVRLDTCMRLYQRWLVKGDEKDELTYDQRIGLVDKIRQAAVERGKALQSLMLGEEGTDSWAALLAGNRASTGELEE